MDRIIFMPKRKTLLRLTISIMVLVLAVVSFTVFLLYSSTINEITAQMRERVKDAAVVSARLARRSKINFTRPGFERTRRYTDLLAHYRNTAQAMGLSDLYIADRSLTLVLAIHGITLDTAKDRVRLRRRELDRVFDGEVISSKLYQKQSRTFVSAYASISDKELNKYMVGVELDVSGGLNLMSDVKSNALLILFVTILASLVISAYLSYYIVGPVRPMVLAAEQIGKGNFSVTVPVSGRDELSFLGQTMNDMIIDIRKRDLQIAELTKGVIDDLRIYNQLIFEGMINGVVVFDMKGKVQSINPAASRILNLDLGMAVGKDVRKLLVFKRTLDKKIDRVISTGETFQNDEVKLVRGTQEILISCDITPLIDREKKTLGYALFFADVTEIRKLESQIKLKEKLAAVGELAAGIAHEIRNPLNSIELFLGLLQRKLEQQSEQTQLVTKVREEVTKLNKILSDFLKFARATPLALSEIDIRGVISDSLLFTKAEVEKRNVECQVELPNGDLKVMIDPEQIQQVFTNIILNGAQAIGDDGRIAISALKEGDEYISVSFSDNGPGIRPEDMQRIFDPFFTTKDTGTGLGLSMSHKIVETHGGSIEVSTEASGTTFKIRLPTMTTFRKRRKTS